MERYASIVTGHVIDERFLGVLHLQALRASGIDHDAVAEHGAFQVGTIETLMGGAFDGRSSIAQVLAHGSLGVGTLNHLAGELTILDRVAYLCDAGGAARIVGPEELTPFAVVSPFDHIRSTRIGPCADLGVLREAITAFIGDEALVAAFRLDGRFATLHARSVHPQRPPYVSLAEATRNQSEFDFIDVEGTVVGFSFPDVAAGIEVPGFHLHFLTADRRRGGHVLEAQLDEGTLQVDATTELRLELPKGVDLGRPGAMDRAALQAIENQRH
jgi:acetolactate decarboxylase